MIKNLLLGLCVIFLAVLVQRMYKVMTTFKFGHRVHNHQPGPCALVKGIEEGSEDIQVLPNGIALVTSGLKFKVDWNVAPWKGRRGRILAFDFNNPDLGAQEVTVKGGINLDEFHPHGLSIFTDKKTGVVTVFVISHRPDKEVVEKFTFDSQKRILNHVRTIEDELIGFPNDLVAVTADSFYFTNYQKYKDGVLSELEFALGMKNGYVGFYDGQKGRYAMEEWSTFFIPNGINVSPDGKYLYLMHIGDGEVISYEIQPDHTLKFIDKMFISTAGDNIDIDPKNGDIWIGAHPIPWKTMGFLKDPTKNSSPSQVLLLTTDGKGNFKTTREVYMDEGDEIAGSTVAVKYKNKLIIGTVNNKALLCELKYY